MDIPRHEATLFPELMVDEIIFNHASSNLSMGIIKRECWHGDITMVQLLGSSRLRKIVDVRSTIAVRLLRECGMSYSAIGRKLNRAPSTVINLLWRAGEIQSPNCARKRLRYHGH